MSVSRAGRLGLSAVALASAAALLAACHNSTSPNSSAQADTVSINQSSSVVIEFYFGNGSPGWYSDPAIEDGDYVESYNNNPGDYGDFREIAEYALPTLKGRKVVDSATVSWYACDFYNSNDGGQRVPRRARPNARRPTAFLGSAHTLDGGETTDTVVVDHIDFGATYTDSASYGSETLASTIAVLIYGGDETIGWKTASVTSAVQADYAAGRTRSQYRLRYSSLASFDEFFVDFAGEECEDDTGASGPSFLVVYAH